ncbi:MAG: prolyl oligopeptidase family serine peptidase [Vicinamibacterales bacterium]|jgi:dipeptidyl aminopeptidase/acylaminoacyl peptidase|nr:prolyl oligopeptidase family serine peptidase [Vicinamibacterales bacterium]
MPKRALAALLILLAALPIAAPAQPPAQAPSQAPAKPAAAPAPLKWTDETLKQEGYATPPKELADAVLAPRYRNVALTNASPDKKWFLDEIGDGPVGMAVFSKPFHELGGLFVDYQANRARPLTIRNNAGLQVISAADGSKKAIQIPNGVRVSNAAWSPDGSLIAFYVHTPDATHIWVADPMTGVSKQLTQKPVLATLVSNFDFSADGKKIAAVIVPDGRAAMPGAPAAPSGPQVKVADDADKNRLRTFPSLMATPYDFQLLEWHATGQVVVLDVTAPMAPPAKGRAPKNAPAAGMKKIGQPQMVRSLDLSPDGKYLRVTRVTKPFSYVVPVSNFGSTDEVWDLDGKVMVELDKRPLNEGVQDDTQPPPDPAAGPGGAQAQQQGRRELAWRADGQGLTFLEQESPSPLAPGDGTAGAAASAPRPADQATTGRGGRGAGASEGPRRPDRLYQWLPPFDKASLKMIFESSARMSGHRFSPDHQVLFFSERTGQNTVENAVYLSEPAKRYTISRFRADDVYANPGSIMLARGGGGGGRGAGAGAAPGGRGGAGGPGGGVVLLSPDGSSVYLQGTAYDKNPLETGPKSFVDKVAIKTGEKKRVYESGNGGVFERVTTPIDLDAGRYIVSRESPTEIAQYYLVDGPARTALTTNEDATPDLTRAPKDRFIVERPDGFKFRVSVTLPPGYQKGTRLPAIFWFYPREFATQEDYDRGIRTYNRNEAPNFGTRSMQFFVRLGYAVVEPDAPIVGPTGKMNDNYEHDLRNNLAAVIDELDRREIVDRHRLAIGGHSYGAFSAVNAMVHTPFFKAGIAGDGAYNRTLTPLGFQSERRDLWEAKDVYLSMSPFLYAQNLTGALLMYHGLGDQNVGTDPTNSTRLFHALNGLGKTTALYLYPLEDHGPATRETLLDLWARWAAWLDKYVKNPEPAKAVKK